MFGAGVRAYVCVELVDMRKSIDGLSQLVQPLFSADAFGGQVFVFSRMHQSGERELFASMSPPPPSSLLCRTG